MIYDHSYASKKGDHAYEDNYLLPLLQFCTIITNKKLQAYTCYMLTIADNYPITNFIDDAETTILNTLAK